MTTDLFHDVGGGADHEPTVSTRILHADRIADVGHGAVHAPMHTSVLYGYGSARELQKVFQGHKPGFTYARQGNPTGAALEAKLNLLEETRATICFATGMAAISATFLALLRAGDHVVCSRYVFGNTVGVLRTLEGFGLEVSYVDSTDASQVAACWTMPRFRSPSYAPALSTACIRDIHGNGGWSNASSTAVPSFLSPTVVPAASRPRPPLTLPPWPSLPS